MRRKKILIFDEPSFARVCSALLQNAGYKSETISAAGDVPSAGAIRKFSLIIASYPFCAPIIENIRQLGISTIILSDDMDENLFTTLKDLSDSYCMMKPLDYEKFMALVRQVMSSEKTKHGGSHYYFA